jgi:hypothetical protein
LQLQQSQFLLQLLNNLLLQQPQLKLLQQKQLSLNQQHLNLLLPLNQLNQQLLPKNLNQNHSYLEMLK